MPGAGRAPDILVGIVGSDDVDTVVPALSLSSIVILTF